MGLTINQRIQSAEEHPAMFCRRMPKKLCQKRFGKNEKARRFRRAERTRLKDSG
jgi:hypothetical protein